MECPKCKNPWQQEIAPDMERIQCPACGVLIRLTRHANPQVTQTPPATAPPARPATAPLASRPAKAPIAHHPAAPSEPPSPPQPAGAAQNVSPSPPLAGTTSHATDLQKTMPSTVDSMTSGTEEDTILGAEPSNASSSGFDQTQAPSGAQPGGLRGSR